MLRRHRWTFLILLSAVLLMGKLSFAQSAGDQGFGLIVGYPAGLTGKVWLDDNFAIDGAFGVASSELDVHLDILFHDFELLKRLNVQPTSSRLRMPIYMGVGPKILFEDKSEFGLRTPAGISVFPENTNWEFFFELAPVIRLTPDVGLNMDYGVGARYYFLAVRPR